jgi:hypothetical protein
MRSSTDNIQQQQQHVHDDDDDENDTIHEDDDDARRRRVHLYLRLRPISKLEASKRSKDCIELHDDPKILTVDSPLQGSFNFTFDMVGLGSRGDRLVNDE